MSIVRPEDFIQSVADALQHISYYHPVDYIEALGEAYALEQSPAARDAIAVRVGSERATGPVTATSTTPATHR